MKNRTLTEISCELDGIAALGEVLAIYLQSAFADVPEVDVLNTESLVDAVRGLSTYCERLSHDLETVDLSLSKGKKNC